MSGKVPADRVAILRNAFDAMIADPAFRAEAARLNLLVTPMTGQEVARRIAELYATPPDVIAAKRRKRHSAGESRIKSVVDLPERARRSRGRRG